MGARVYYTEDFKRQIVELKRSGRPVLELSREYKITATSIRSWDKQLSNSGEFGKTANISEAEKELKALRKENNQLKMEVDILKQAALILGRNGK
jgi:transposase